jgi:gamma-glutamyl-gamma-aminobutyrate hydrolase PuuD
MANKTIFIWPRSHPEARLALSPAVLASANADDGIVEAVGVVSSLSIGVECFHAETHHAMVCSNRRRLGQRRIMI